MRNARTRAQMTRRQLALESGTSERYLAQLEAGSANPTLNVLTALASSLRVPVADLIPLGGERDEWLEQLVSAVRRLPEDRLSQLAVWLDPAQGRREGRIALLGLPGAGKSTLGRELAGRLSAPFVDLAERIDPVRVAFGGPETAGRLAVDAWEAVVAGSSRAVIELPHALLHASGFCGRVLDSAHTVWLDAAPEDHLARVAETGSVPAEARGVLDEIYAALSALEPVAVRASRRLNTSAVGVDAALASLEDWARSLIEADPRP
ncbi:helix-turn-helix domain-containing protein [Pseudonocardia sp. CA-107938]|uniref:helix-turn-helix domain-containing protein n=1 Tax=Pseudonocardia sp. CA-107938 TaxID=3240021 RepID=UPI003D8AC39C